MLTTAVALASSSANASARAAALAVAVLASRKSDPAIRGRMFVKRSPKVKKTGIPAPPLAAPAPPADSSSQHRPAGAMAAAPALSAASLAPLTATSSNLTTLPMVQLPVGSSSQSRPAASPAQPAEATPMLVMRSTAASAAVMAPLPVASALLSDGHLGSDPAVVVEGLGSLSLPPAALGGPVSTEESSVEDVDGDEELAPQSSMASTNGAVSGSVHGNTDVRHIEVAPAEPCGGLSGAVAALDDEKGWVQVGLGARPVRAPSSPSREEGLDRSLVYRKVLSLP